MKIQTIGPLDTNFGWVDGELLREDACHTPFRADREVRGAYACVSIDGDRVTVARDPAGINKLFWACSGGRIKIAARPIRLVQQGISFEEIRAVPSGLAATMDAATGTVGQHRLPTPKHDPLPDDTDLSGLASSIATIVRQYLAALAEALPVKNVFVCLSGGLDSTIVALLAREHFANVTAASFDLARSGGKPSEDRQLAERLARDLDIAFLPVTVSEDDLLQQLDLVLTEGIDWRDFNVHAGLINAALAEGIADAVGKEPRLALTGDIMNELLVDYEPEVYGGRTYYQLPKLPKRALQRALVRGMETSHREVGLFEAFGVPVVQPYAVVIPEYLRLPDRLLADPDRKTTLAHLVMRDTLPQYVYGRAKTRAQVGDPHTGRGVLAICADRGIDEAYLAQRFAELHNVTDVKALSRFIRGGRYRSAVPTFDQPAN